MKLTLKTLEQRIANQERRVTDGLQSGTLNSTEAKQFRQGLERLQSRLENDAFDGNGLSRGASIGRGLSRLDQHVQSARRDSVQDLNTRVNNFDQRITRGVADGSLTADEASTLKSQAATLRTQLSQAATPEAQQALVAQADQLSKAIAGARHNGTVDGTKRLERFKGRIAQGLEDGSLTSKEASRLTSRLASVDGKLSSGEASAREINGLNRAIFHQRHDAQVDPALVSKRLEASISKAEQAGSLTPDQVSNLRSQLLEITSSQTNTGAEGARLNALQQELRAALTAKSAA